MTAGETKSLKILGAIALPLLTALVVGAWASKESAADHNQDVARIESSVQRILDVVCADKPQARACVSR